MKGRGNPPTMRTVRRVDGSMYHTLNTQRLRNASPLQTVLPAQRRISIASIVLIALIVTLIALAVIATNAHAQTCQVGNAPAPAMTCLHPQVYLPEVTR